MEYIKQIIFHPNPRKRVIISVLYCGTGILVNFFCLQVFCMPVPYAALMCIAFFGAVLVLPFVKRPRIKTILYFLLGTGVPICLYCIVFLADPYSGFVNYLFFALEVLLLGAGLLAFIPFYLLHHIRMYYREAQARDKRVVIAGICSPLIALSIYFCSLHGYLQVVKNAEVNVHSTGELMNRLPKNYFTERYLGLHWKYHTRLCYIYDGWRPPLNDPFLITSMWFYGVIAGDAKDVFNNQYWPLYLKDNVKCYKELFPSNPLNIRCPCSFDRNGREYLRVDFEKIKN